MIKVQCILCRGTGLVKNKKPKKQCECGRNAQCYLCENGSKLGLYKECFLCYGVGEVVKPTPKKKNSRLY